ncbi:hypothetical protein [Vibrio campbellii]|uniref:Uncharacterized protein n=3 Tax=Vibrio campbellii TaxID=680 RepID=A7MRS0_VIBC1|nr:hypothetical protein [Vibrio campbellii]ABU70638.1 hypothetical protein VIBHAR_01669 [Vibrio campbellii ATCC BAA-1116]AGU96332.1 hypothetical protein M892_04795 [Vibrio campbellii ATCC BAA-1116]MBT0124375.1 hypothetical protein [Vibrio campbellii]MBT0139279.1 hypothetical protein [Vibrio campbellii]MBT0143962.1 hypothetical protein [Vibrio campbellii]
MFKFDFFLKEFVLQKCSRKELMNRLVSNYDEFVGLDPVTMSRWINGITTPPIRRQILIAHCAGCIRDYVLYSSFPPAPLSLMSDYGLYVEQFDNVYHSLLKDIVNKELFSFIGKQKNLEKIIGFYMNKMLFHKSLRESEDINIEMFYLAERCDNKAESFVGVTSDTSLYLSKLKIKFDYPELHVDDSIMVTLSFFRSKQDFEQLVGRLLSHILFNYFDKKGLFLIVRGARSMNWFDSIGAQKVCLIEYSKEHGNVYLYYINTHIFFGNALVLSLVQEHVRIHNSKINYLARLDAKLN